MRTALWMLYVICIIYYMLCILYMIPLSVNANGVFTLIYTFFTYTFSNQSLKKWKWFAYQGWKTHEMTKKYH